MALSHHVVLAGGSGVVGSRVLERLLPRPEVVAVTAIGRRVLPTSDAKLSSKLADLQRSADVAAQLPDGVTLAVCCLGTTIKHAGSQAAFRTIDHDAVVAFATAAQSRGARHFVLVSSLGADPQSRNFYLRTKGEAEASVQALGYSRLTIVRPSFIDDEGTRTERRPGERFMLPLARAVFALVGRRHRFAPIKASVIASAVVRLALDETDTPFRIIESDELQTQGE